MDYKATGDSDLLSILSSQVKKVSTDTAVLYLRVEDGKNCIVNLSKAGSVLHSLSGKKEEISFVAEVTSVAGTLISKLKLLLGRYIYIHHVIN